MTATDFQPGVKPDAVLLRLIFENGTCSELVVPDPDRARAYYEEFEGNPARGHQPVEWIGATIAECGMLLQKRLHFRPSDVVCCEFEQHPLSIYSLNNEEIPSASSLVSDAGAVA